MLSSSVPCSSSVASHSCAFGNSIHQREETTKVCKNTGLKTIAQTIAINRFYLHWEKLNTAYVK